jgi:hypothetical protein
MDLSAASGQRSSGAAAALRPQAAPPQNWGALRSWAPRDHHQPNDHPAWSPPLAWHHADALPRTPCGAGEQLLRPMLPRHPAGTLALDQRPVSARRPGAPPGRRPRGGPGYGRPHASQARPTPDHPFPSGPMQAGDHAAGGPRRHVDPLRPAGAARHTSHSRSSAARTARRRRGHRRPVRPDTWMPRTPGCTGRVDAGRPLDRLDGHPHGGPDEADRATTGPAGVRTSRDRRHPLGGPTAPGSRRLGALGHPRLLRGDGTCAAALTAAATGQLPSPARHEAAPRRTALVCWIWMVRGEGNGTTEAEGCGVRSVRECC